MALDTRGLASGFAQGFGLTDNYYTRQEQGERADRRLEMQEETFDMQKQQFEGQQEKEKATFVFGKIANNMDLSDEEMTWLKDNPNYLAALNPEADKALEIAQRVIDPQDELDLNSEEGLYALNTMFEPMINRGKGGQKRIAAGLPGRTEGTMAFELDVAGEDGNPYRAPMTRSRGVAGEDDEIREVPVENMVNAAQGVRMLRNVINTNGASENAAKLYSMLTGKTPEPVKGININGQLVNPTTGEAMGDFRTPEQRKGKDPSLSPQQEVYAKRLQSEVDHLWRMERQIQTGQSDGMSIFLGGMEETVTPENKDALLSDIRTRIQANEQELNKLLGVSAPQPGYDALIQEAENIPPEQREKELAELKNNPRVPYMVIRKIEQMWGMGGGTPQPGPQADPAPAPGPTQAPAPNPQPEPQPQPQPGVAPPYPADPGQPPSQQMGLQDPNAGRPVLERQLGPMIESGAKAVGEAISTRANKNINKAAKELSRIAKGEAEPYQGNIRQFLTNNPEAVKRLSPADLQRLQQRYGERFINQFL